MSKVGFLKENGASLTGAIRTMKLSARLQLDRAATKRDAGSPDYIASAILPTGELIEIGAAWTKTGKRGESAGRQFLSLTLDDPSFDEPLNVSAFPGAVSGEFDVVWRRERQSAKDPA